MNSRIGMKSEIAANNFSNHLVGRKFGFLKVTCAAKPVKYNRRWLCECDCGVSKIVYEHNLKSRNTISCGCSLGRD